MGMRGGTHAAAALVSLTLGLGGLWGCTGCSSDADDESRSPSTAADRPDDHRAIYVIDASPSADATLSPHTGWTRAHHELAFARVITGWADTLSEGGAQTRLPGGEALPAAFEGSARVLPVIAAWLSDPANASMIRFEGQTVDLLGLLRRALLHGTDPTHVDYWGAIEEGWDQKSVEAAFVCEALWLAGDRLWSTFSERERVQILRWLSPAESNFPNNWALFVGVRNVTRAHLGASHDAELTAAQMAVMDDLALGDGWYSDGGGAQVDFYNGFVVHHFLALWAGLGDELGDGLAPMPSRRAQIERRLRAWLHDLPYFYARDGSRVPFGRSLAYRDAHLSVLALAHRLDVSPLEPGQARRLVSGALAAQLGSDGRGVGGLLDDQDVISRGWLGDDPRALESYQRPGSQNFAARALMVLMIPRDDPFWTAAERPIPADQGDFEHAIPAAGFSLVGLDGGREVRLLSTRSAKGNADKYLTRYRKLLYSSRFFPDLAAEDGSFPDDASVALGLANGGSPPRGMPIDGTVAPGFARTVFEVPLETPHRIVTTAWARADATVRLSCHEATLAGTVAIGGGLTVPRTAQTRLWRPDAVAAMAVQSPIAPGSFLGEDPRRDPDDDLTWLVSSVHGLHGYVSAAPRHDLPGVGLTNMVWASTTTPRLFGAPMPIDAPACTLAVRRAAAREQPLEDAALLDWTRGPVEAFTVDQDQAAAHLRVADGEVWLAAQPTPTARSLELGALSLVGPLAFASVAEPEGAGGVRVVVAGVERIDQDETTLLEFDAPALLELEMDAGRWRMVTDTGFSASPEFEVGSVMARAFDGTAADVTSAALDASEGEVTVSPDLHARFATDVSRTLATFEIRSER